MSLDSSVRQKCNLLLLSPFAGISLWLAAVRIYSVMSYGVERRTHEFGNPPGPMPSQVAFVSLAWARRPGFARLLPVSQSAALT